MSIYGRFYRGVRWLVRRFRRRYSVRYSTEAQQHGLSPGEPAVYVSRHRNMHGPVTVMLWFQEEMHPMSLHVFTKLKDCYDHFLGYTFTQRYGWWRPFAQVAAWVVSKVVAKTLNSGKAIPVYRGSTKVIKTFRIGMEYLRKGENIVVFPDVDYIKDDGEESEIYEGFLSLERFYFKETGRHLAFVPIHIDDSAEELVVGGAVRFTGERPFAEEKDAVRDVLREKINRIDKENVQNA